MTDQRELGSSSSHLCESCPIFRRCSGCFAIPPKIPADRSAIKYALIGEAPGKSEVEKGEPFIGPSGQLLRRALEFADLPIGQIFISNGTWCPPRGAPGMEIVTPEKDEILHCLPHTLAQIAALRPRVIICAGSATYSALAGPKRVSILKDHGRWFRMNLPFTVRYETFRKWLSYKVQVIDGLNTLRPEQKVKEFYGMGLNPVEQEASCQAQIDRAIEELGYSEDWYHLDVMPVVHPAYVLRNGADGQWYDHLRFDLEKARMKVEGVSAPLMPTKYRWIESAAEWERYVNETIQLHKDGKVPVIAVDVETSIADYSQVVGLAPFDPRVRLLSLQVSRYDYESEMILVNHQQSKIDDPVSMQVFRHHLDRLLHEVPVVGQNFKFDSNVLRCRLGIYNINVVGDTHLMDHWLTSGKGLGHGLDEMGARYCGTGKHKTAVREWREKNPGKDLESMDLQMALDYGCGDADVTRRVYWHLRKQLETTTQWDLFYEHYFGRHGCWQVIVDLEWSGMPVDQPVLDRLHVEYPKRIQKCYEDLNSLPILHRWFKPRYDRAVVELEEFNAKILASGSKRRKAAPIPSYEEWLAETKIVKGKVTYPNWYNPASVPQTLDLWKNALRLQFGQNSKGREIFLDMEYADEDCPICRRKSGRCKCKQKHIPSVPKTNDHNRGVIIDCLEPLLEKLKALPPSEKRDTNIQRTEQTLALIKATSEYKKMSKMYGTYVDGIYPLIIDRAAAEEPSPNERCYRRYHPYADFPSAWRLHPSYNMAGTETGRLSSSDPNGQNFPERGADPKANVKLPYISQWRGKGGILIQPDYSQIEIRVMVVESDDHALADVLNSGRDIHKFVASMVHGVPEDRVTKEMRTPVKSVTFGILYGQSTASLAQSLKISLLDGERLVEKFFAQLPKVRGFIEKQRACVDQNAYVTTRLGRIRWLPHIRSEYLGEKNKAYRDCVNTPIQSIASDLCWQAYGRLWKAIKELTIPAVPYSIIHDSQTFDVGPGYLLDVMELQYYQMVWQTLAGYPWLFVKPEVDFSIGASWGAMVGAKLFWDKDTPEQIIHGKLGLSGHKENIDAVQEEMVLGGLRVAVCGADGPHPKKEEADLGVWYREIQIEAPSTVCRLSGRKLEVVSR